MIKALSLLDRVGDKVFAFFNLAPIMSDEGSHMLQSGRKGGSLCPRKGQIKPRGLFAWFHLGRGLTLGHDELLRWCRGGGKMLYRSSPDSCRRPARHHFFLGTLLPFSRAFDSPIAMACLR